MGTKKISELTEATELNDDDLVAVVDVENEATKKITVGNLIGIVNGIDIFSSSNNYAIGDFCIYDNILYKCNTAVTSGNDFDIMKWDKTSISAEIKNKLTWNLLGEFYNTTDTANTTQITISNINQYSEFLLTAGNDSQTNRVLASSIIPKDIFAGIAGNGQHQASYYPNQGSAFRSGVSYDATSNSLTLYAGAHSAMRLYAR